MHGHGAGRGKSDSKGQWQVWPGQQYTLPPTLYIEIQYKIPFKGVKKSIDPPTATKDIEQKDNDVVKDYRP